MPEWKMNTFVGEYQARLIPQHTDRNVERARKLYLERCSGFHISRDGCYHIGSE